VSGSGVSLSLFFVLIVAAGPLLLPAMSLVPDPCVMVRRYRRHRRCRADPSSAWLPPPVSRDGDDPV
jgi:hypothetical protein